jgi:hypothetical protein
MKQNLGLDLGRVRGVALRPVIADCIREQGTIMIKIRGRDADPIILV